MLVLSRETNPVVQARCEKLNIECHQGTNDKKTLLTRILSERGIESAQVVFVGNDINDLECMRMVGCAVTPADAYPEVIKEADWILNKSGGQGAVRELCDLIISAINKRRKDHG